MVIKNKKENRVKNWDALRHIRRSAGINSHIGRRPVAAFGNSDGDLQMLQWTAAGSGTRLCLYVHHTDAKREWAYDRKSWVGRLDKGLYEGQVKGWTVVDMKQDWKIIFPFQLYYDHYQKDVKYPSSIIIHSYLRLESLDW